MEYLGDKLTVAHTHMNQWMGTMRRSLQEALSLVSTAVTHERTSIDSGSRNPFKRTSSFRHFASRSRESFRRFSVRSQQRFSSLRKRHASSDQNDPDQVKQCFSRTSASNKDTDSLVQEADRRYGTWIQEQQQSEDSFVHESPSFDTTPSQKHPPHSRLSSLSQTETDQHDSVTDPHDASLDRSSMDLDSTESTPSFKEAKTDFSFMDQTSVLDSTALKNRVVLSRKSQRRAPSQSQRKSRLLQSSSQLAVIEDSDSPWMYTDTTEDKPEKEEEYDEDEKPQRISIQPQRMPMFPGMDPSALKAQLRKRQDQESSSETQVQPAKSPKSPLPQGTIGIKLLPTAKDKQDRGAEESPQWLKELKSKKRQSQYENQS
uniref:Tankyrase 1-binding protein C-terminal domain-containing protein n=1 Tax=Leptobrachium leishanense TaxID=445787 RepID=A0A8C5LY03_9ANUR